VKRDAAADAAHKSEGSSHLDGARQDTLVDTAHGQESGGEAKPNAPPVAKDDTASTPYNTAVDISVLANDTDADGDSLSILSPGTPSHGTVTKNANSTLHYLPAAGFSGTDSFTYSVTDAKGGTASAKVTVTVAPPPAGGSWIPLPAGTFKMGSPSSESCRATDETQHQVTLTHSFEIQATEVTQGQFQSVLGYNPSYFSSCGSLCPVENVKWHEAVAYCNALSQKAALTSCYSCTGSQSSVSCNVASVYTGQKLYQCPG
jgi:formylglycine-generating enzyme required for sulfatase activity